jgi:tRNA G18 (ribose-2'-O)-methylase SpoU
MSMRKPTGGRQPPGENKSAKSRSVGRNEFEKPGANNQSNAVNTIYGLIPVLEVLRAGGKKLEQITIAEGARHDRLRELLNLAKQAGVPIHRAPRLALDRALPGVVHQGVIAKTAAASYRDPDELLDELSSQVGTATPPLILG